MQEHNFWKFITFSSYFASYKNAPICKLKMKIKICQGLVSIHYFSLCQLVKSSQYFKSNKASEELPELIKLNSRSYYHVILKVCKCPVTGFASKISAISSNLCFIRSCVLPNFKSNFFQFNSIGRWQHKTQKAASIAETGSDVQQQKTLILSLASGEAKVVHPQCSALKNHAKHG